MIINLLDTYTSEEQERILDIAERWHVYEYRRSSNTINLYGAFNNAPYWGDGICINGKCESCEHNAHRDIDGSCELYIDSAYEDWFEGLITNNEMKEIIEINDKIKRQIKIFADDEEWEELGVTLSFSLLKWLNDNKISYCIIRDLPGKYDHIFVKNFYKNSEYRLRFGSPNDRDLTYAVDDLGWRSYDISELTNITDREQKRIIESWIHENKTGIVHRWNGGILLFENEIDAMAIKLKWSNYDEI